MTVNSHKPFKACIFDMDGVLLDSEPFWRQAEREIFATVGLNLTEEDCMETMGVRIDELVVYRHSQKPWNTPSCAEIANKIQLRVAELVKEKGTRLPGVLSNCKSAIANFLLLRKAFSGIATQAIRAALAAITPFIESSIAKQSIGSTLSNFAVFIYTAGWGLP